jgi:hypothetical protein
MKLKRNFVIFQNRNICQKFAAIFMCIKHKTLSFNGFNWVFCPKPPTRRKLAFAAPVDKWRKLIYDNGENKNLDTSTFVLFAQLKWGSFGGNERNRRA